MITQDSIPLYHGGSLMRGDSFIFLPPNPILQPYIANYTISFPTPETMPAGYTILPTASSTLVITADGEHITGGLRGVNTASCRVGAFAGRMRLLLLVEFRPGRLYPFFPVDQFELVNTSFPLEALDRPLYRSVEEALLRAESIKALVESLDIIFLDRLTEHNDRGIPALLGKIAARHGNISTRELSGAFYYSEKHMNRLFMRYVGTSSKTFSRIVRVNYALRLLQQPRRVSDVAAEAGFFDQPHLIRDFKALCGLTPEEYRQNMSVYYNDWSKM